MDDTTRGRKVTEWLERQVDPAFEPLREKIAGSGTLVQWDQGDFGRTICLQISSAEITYAITIDPDSDPPTGTVLFKTPDSESRKSFEPALDGCPKPPRGMTGSDLVDDLISQYGQWLRRTRPHDETPGR